MQRNTGLATEILADVLKKDKTKNRAIACLMSETVALSIGIAGIVILLLIRDRGWKK